MPRPTPLQRLQARFGHRSGELGSWVSEVLAERSYEPRELERALELFGELVALGMIHPTRRNFRALVRGHHGRPV